MPLAKDFRERFAQFHDFLGNHPSEKTVELMDSIKWLEFNSASHATVDTFAKRLYLNGDVDQLKELKAGLSCYLLYEHANSGIDLRYDTFLASILEREHGRIIFPPNLKILTWNYDMHFEVAFSFYYKEINRPPGVLFDDTRMSDYYIRVSDEMKARPVYSGEIASDDFCLIHLNGIAGGSNHKQPMLDIDNVREVPLVSSKVSSVNDKAKFLEWLGVKYSSLIEDSFLNFAWETNSQKSTAVRDETMKHVQDAEIMVVIGYSFPFFNRKIDKKLIRSMEKLKKFICRIQTQPI